MGYQEDEMIKDLESKTKRLHNLEDNQFTYDTLKGFLDSKGIGVYYKSDPFFISHNEAIAGIKNITDTQLREEF